VLAQARWNAAESSGTGEAYASRAASTNLHVGNP
jgi:hypothetical protein